MTSLEFAAGFVAGVCALVGAATLVTAGWLAVASWLDWRRDAR